MDNIGSFSLTVLTTVQQTFFLEVKQITKLAIPLFLTQLIAALMFFTDTVIASQAGYLDMAAVSVATGIWYPITFTAQGLLISVTPVVAHLFGASKNGNNNAAMVSKIFQGGYLAAIACMLVLFIFQFVDVPLNRLDLEPELYNKSMGYLNYVVWGFFPAALFYVL